MHIEDLASAHLAALEFLLKHKKSEDFNLGSGKGYSVMEIVRQVEKVTGQKVKVKICPRRKGDPARLVAASEKAARVLGWKPRHDMENIIRTAWNWERTSPRCARLGLR